MQHVCDSKRQRNAFYRKRCVAQSVSTHKKKVTKYTQNHFLNHGNLEFSSAWLPLQQIKFRGSLRLVSELLLNHHCLHFMFLSAQFAPSTAPYNLAPKATVTTGEHHQLLQHLSYMSHFTEGLWGHINHLVLIPLRTLNMPHFRAISKAKKTSPCSMFFFNAN